VVHEFVQYSLVFQFVFALLSLRANLAEAVHFIKVKVNFEGFVINLIDLVKDFNLGHFVLNDMLLNQFLVPELRHHCFIEVIRGDHRIESVFEFVFEL
jgi:hypothetical protein